MTGPTSNTKSFFVDLFTELCSYVPVHIEQTGDDDDDFIVKAVDDAPKAQVSHSSP